jgi:hypothetical protein
MPTGSTPLRCGVTYRVCGASLLAGRAVHRCTRVTGASPPRGHPSTGATTNRWRCPADEQAQRPVSGNFLRALRQGLGMNRSEHRATAWIHHGNHNLRFARSVEHNPVELWTATGDLDELANVHRLHLCRLHRHSLPGPARRRPALFGPPSNPPSVSFSRQQPLKLADLDSGRIARQVSRSPYPDTATRQARSTGPRDGRDARRRPAPHTGETGRVARGLVLGRDDPPRGPRLGAPAGRPRLLPPQGARLRKRPTTW